MVKLTQRSAKWDLKYKQMQILYNIGKYDREIADEIGCALYTVKLWRKREGLISQTERQKKRAE